MLYAYVTKKPRIQPAPSKAAAAAAPPPKKKIENNK